MILLEKFEKQGIWLFKHRSFLPLIVLLIGLLIYVNNELYPGPVTLEDTVYESYYEFFCLSISLLGLVIRMLTVGYTPSNTSGRNTCEQVADSLNTTGMYSMVRHPLYLGNFFMWLGPALLTGHFWFIISFCFFYWLYYERIMFAEEQFLKRKFGAIYTAWANVLPAFIPDFRKYKSPDLAFSWKKVLKKEKNGLFATFIVFVIFDICGNLIKQSGRFNYFLLAGLLITMLTYGVLKYLKMKTQIFDEPGR